MDFENRVWKLQKEFLTFQKEGRELREERREMREERREMMDFLNQTLEEGRCLYRPSGVRDTYDKYHSSHSTVSQRSQEGRCLYRPSGVRDTHDSSHSTGSQSSEKGRSLYQPSRVKVNPQNTVDGTTQRGPHFSQRSKGDGPTLFHRFEEGSHSAIAGVPQNVGWNPRRSNYKTSCSVLQPRSSNLSDSSHESSSSFPEKGSNAEEAEFAPPSANSSQFGKKVRKTRHQTQAPTMATFDGTPSMWKSFVFNFEKTIRVSRLSERKKRQMLVACLRDRAAVFAGSLPRGTLKEYQKLLKSLKKRYGHVPPTTMRRQLSVLKQDEKDSLKEPKLVHKDLKKRNSTIHHQRALLGKSVTSLARSLCVESEESGSLVFFTGFNPLGAGRTGQRLAQEEDTGQPPPKSYINTHDGSSVQRGCHH